ncbi:MAG: hypothetical protein LBR10_16375 [Prevotellaceae bacterium]|jgi:hypothetical protein|nr:hypothetical protein [Prevotellaceae bacterium]
MMNCEKCNFQNNGNAQFCINCGTELKEQPVKNYNKIYRFFQKNFCGLCGLILSILTSIYLVIAVILCSIVFAYVSRYSQHSDGSDYYKGMSYDQVIQSETGFGVDGFILMGILMCFLGIGVSFAGLFKKPRSTAITGLSVSILMLLFSVIWFIYYSYNLHHLHT